jgi:hypothetical protein
MASQGDAEFPFADLYSSRYELHHRAVCEQDLQAQHDFQRLLEEEDEIALELEEQRRVAQAAYAAKRGRTVRRAPIRRVVRRGRERRPACNARRRGSRRTASTRAGPDESGDPHQDEPPSDLLTLGGRR